MKKILFLLIGLFLISFTNATTLYACGTYGSGSYQLNQSISSATTCLTFNSSNVILDLNGYNITWNAGAGASTLRGITINANLNNFTIFGGQIIRATTSGTGLNGVSIASVTAISNVNIYNLTLNTATNFGTNPSYISLAAATNVSIHDITCKQAVTASTAGFTLSGAGSNQTLYNINMSNATGGFTLAGTNINLTNITTRLMTLSGVNITLNNISFTQITVTGASGNIWLNSFANRTSKYNFNGAGIKLIYSEAENNISIIPKSGTGNIYSDLNLSLNTLNALGTAFNTSIASIWLNISGISGDGRMSRSSYVCDDCVNLTEIKTGMINFNVTYYGGTFTPMSSPYCPIKTKLNYNINQDWHCTLKDTLSLGLGKILFYNNGFTYFNANVTQTSGSTSRLWALSGARSDIIPSYSISNNYVYGSTPTCTTNLNLLDKWGVSFWMYGSNLRIGNSTNNYAKNTILGQGDSYIPAYAGKNSLFFYYDGTTYTLRSQWGNLPNAGACIIDITTKMNGSTGWHNYVYTEWMNATDLGQLWIDGVYIGSCTYTNTGNATVTKIFTVDNHYVEGNLMLPVDELVLYNRSLTQADATSQADGQYNQQSDDSSLVGIFHFDEGSGALSINSVLGNSNATWTVTTPTYNTNNAGVGILFPNSGKGQIYLNKTLGVRFN